MTKKQFNLDGYQSAVLGNRKGARLTSVTAPLLYSRGGIFAKLVDKPADDALSGDITIHGDVSGSLKTEFERLNVKGMFADAVRWCRLTGGAAIIPIVRGGGDLEAELTPESIEEIEELRVYAANEISIYGNRYHMPESPKHGKPMLYQVATQSGSFIVHESRLFHVQGEPLPPSQNSSGIFWQGRDAVARSYQAVLDLISAVERVGQILERKQQPIYAMQGLAQAIEMGRESEIQKRIDLVDITRGILNTVATDNLDSYTIADLNVGGLDQVINIFKEQVCAESGMPLSLLFGRSAAGMNATGEGDFRNYYDMVDGIRTRQVMPPLERLTALLAAQGSLKGAKIADDWRIEFAPLFEPTAKEKAEVQKIEAETLNTTITALTAAVQFGAISEREAYAYLQQRGYFGLTAQTENEAVEYAASV